MLQETQKKTSWSPTQEGQWPEFQPKEVNEKSAQVLDN